MLADYKEGMTWTELQKKYNCSVTTVHDVLIRNNIDRNRFQEQTWSIEKRDEFKRMYLSNCTYPEIRAKFNICSSNVTWWAHKLKLPMRGSGRNNTYENKFAARTPESDYWLGYIFADGHISYNEQRRSYRVSLYTEKEYVIEKYKEWFGYGINVKSRQYITKDSTVHNMYCATIGSKHIAQWFSETLGISSKKHHNLNPNIDINWDIIRGYFDGDGSMTIKKGINIKSCSKTWLDRIQEYMESYGITCSVKLSYKDCYGLFVYNKNSLEKILFYMYANPYYCHEYKHEKLANHIAAMQYSKSGELLEA